MTAEDITPAGLEVLPSHEDDVPKQVCHDGSNLPELVGAKYDDKVVAAVNEPLSNVADPYEGENGDDDRVTCTVERRTLFLVLATLVLLIIVGAAVGGAVGGTQAARNKSKNEEANALRNATLSVTASLTGATVTPSASRNISSTSSALATFFPIPESRRAWSLIVYRDSNFSGPWQTISNVGIYDLSFTVISYGKLKQPNLHQPSWAHAHGIGANQMVHRLAAWPIRLLRSILSRRKGCRVSVRSYDVSI